MKIEAFYDPITYTLTYIVYDPVTKDAVVIDPVLDYDQGASQVGFESFEKLKQFVLAEDLKLHYILETHAHADHLSSSQYLKRAFPQAQLVIGERIKEVQAVFKELFNYPALKTDGSQFDYLIKDQEELTAGSLKVKALNTPGHTPACVSYLIGDAIFTGDAIFIEDYGTGRCDFPGGSAADSYHSIHEVLYALPDETRVFVGHDYQPGGRELRYETTIGISKAQNIYLKASTSQDEFIRFRTQRDQGLAAPKLLLPSIQINANAGAFPPPDTNGISYLRIPIRLSAGR